MNDEGCHKKHENARKILCEFSRFLWPSFPQYCCGSGTLSTSSFKIDRARFRVSEFTKAGNADCFAIRRETHIRCPNQRETNRPKGSIMSARVINEPNRRPRINCLRNS